MPEVSAIARKLALKEKMQACFINTPAGFWHEFGTLPKGVALQSGGVAAADWVLVFAKTEKEILVHGPKAISVVKPGGALWTAFPKKASGQQTSLTRDQGWAVVEEANFQVESTASIDAVWTAIRWKLADAE